MKYLIVLIGAFIAVFLVVNANAQEATCSMSAESTNGASMEMIYDRAENMLTIASENVPTGDNVTVRSHIVDERNYVKDEDTRESVYGELEWIFLVGYFSVMPGLDTPEFREDLVEFVNCVITDQPDFS